MLFLRLRRLTRERRRATTATVAAPATKPVAASAAAWPRGHLGDADRLGDGWWRGRDGEAVDDLPLLVLRLAVGLEAHSAEQRDGPGGRLQREGRSGGVPNT